MAACTSLKNAPPEVKTLKKESGAQREHGGRVHESQKRAAGEENAEKREWCTAGVRWVLWFGTLLFRLFGGRIITELSDSIV